MMALFVWWFALPAIARRLMGAVLVCGVIAAAILAYGHARASSGYALGYTRARDGVRVTVAKQFHADEQAHKQKATSLVAVADSIHASHPKPVESQIERIEPITASDSQLVPTVPLSQFTRVYVRNAGRAYLVETEGAAIWYTTDTLLSRHYIPENLKLKAEVVTLRSAFTEQMLAVSAADSAAHYWQSLYEERPVQPPSSSHAKRDLVFTALGIAAGFLAAKRLH